MDVRRRRWRSAGGRKVVAAAIAVGLGVSLGGPAPAAAHTGYMHPAYPDHGFAWLAQYPDSGSYMYLRSERCLTAPVAAAITAMQSTTSGSRSEFRGAWPSGIAPYQTTCGSTFDLSTDIILDFMNDSEWYAAGHGDGYGGHVHSYPADPVAYCDYYGFRKINNKCGLHGTRVHIRSTRYDTYGGGDTTRRNFLIHELSHAYGFIDTCSGDNRINNNTGATGCSLPTGWVAVDRQEMRDHIYPNWMY